MAAPPRSHSCTPSAPARSPLGCARKGPAPCRCRAPTRCLQAAKAKQPQKAIEIFEAMSEVGVQVGAAAPRADSGAPCLLCASGAPCCFPQACTGSSHEGRGRLAAMVWLPAGGLEGQLQMQAWCRCLLHQAHERPFLAANFIRGHTVQPCATFCVLQPNTFSYSALISALARAGRWQVRQRPCPACPAFPVQQAVRTTRHARPSSDAPVLTLLAACCPACLV